ncbi:MAG: hypothetical protein VX293_12370 [Candidatus Latescibacterota bacterium]|nr:hypothetical protein [Candidatus Latescibacterota bacterium]
MLVAVLIGAGCGLRGSDRVEIAPEAVAPGAEPLGKMALEQASTDPSARNASRVPVGELVLGTWLPAGLDRYRFSAEDQRILAELGLNQIEWLQRIVRGGETAEARAMAFCNARGLQMPIFYEPRGYSPYDKLQNWAQRSLLGEGFADSVAQRIRALKTQWDGAAGLQGYLVGHEDYDRKYYAALKGVVAALGRLDSSRPALTVGRIDHYEDRAAFAAAFFQERGQANIFQHEHYVFRGKVPIRGAGLQLKLSFLLSGYDAVAPLLKGRWGRWHAIVQVQSEVREGKVYYRKPTAAEISLQVGLALSRGAAGIVYFMYSSGVEKYRSDAGEWVQTRYYEGLVDSAGVPTASYAAVQRLNGRLRALSPVLESLYFHGATGTAKLRENALLSRADGDLEFGLFGDGMRQTHLLVVNRRTWERRTVALEVKGAGVRDAVTGEVMAVEDGAVAVELTAGGFRLLAVMGAADGG